MLRSSALEPAPRRVRHFNATAGGIPAGLIRSSVMRKTELASFSKLVQGVEHRFVGNADQPAKGLVQLQDQENGPGDSQG